MYQHMPALDIMGRPGIRPGVKIGLHHLRHVCITFAADSAKKKNGEAAPACGTDTESSCLQDNRSLFAADLENTQTL